MNWRTHNHCEPADSNAMTRDRGRSPAWTTAQLAAQGEREARTRTAEAERRDVLSRRYGGREIGTWDGEHTREYDTPEEAAAAATYGRGRVLPGGSDTRVAFSI